MSDPKPIDPQRQPYLQCLALFRAIQKAQALPVETPFRLADRAVHHATEVIETRALLMDDPIALFRSRAAAFRETATDTVSPQERAVALAKLEQTVPALTTASQQAQEFADPRPLRSTDATRERDRTALSGQPLPMIAARMQATLDALTSAQASGDRADAQKLVDGLSLLTQRRNELHTSARKRAEASRGIDR
jgi:hypothetical protein